MLTKLIAVLTAMASVLLANTPFAVKKKDDSVTHRYIIIQDTDQDVFCRMLQEIYGKNNPENEVMYAMGVCGPLLLTDSPAVTAAKAENAFSLAMKYNIPVWFQMDDINNQYYGYVGENVVTCEKWYDNPENTEKLGFGENAPSAPYWFNWGSWMRTPAMPCFNSPGFIGFIQNQLNEGFLPVLRKWLPILKEAGKEYLFAGVSVGWETRMPDYSHMETDITDQNGVHITEAELHQTGYRALENLGYTEEKLQAEAKKQHISAERLRFNLLTQVCHDYSEMICKAVFDEGVPKTKIFTHYVINTDWIITDNKLNYNAPYVWAAVNPYSTPGFTNNSNVSFDRLGLLKTRIALADPTETHYGIVEGYAEGLNEDKNKTVRYFNTLFNSGSLVVAVYGIHDAEGSRFCVPKTSDAPFSRAVIEMINK